MTSANRRNTSDWRRLLLGKVLAVRPTMENLLHRAANSRRSSVWKLGLTLATLAMTVSGCHKATFVNPGTVAGKEHDEWTDFFVFGAVGSEVQNVREYCDGPVAMVRTGSNVGTGVVSVLTLGIYTPRKVYITCAAPSARSAQVEIELDEAGNPTRVARRFGTTEGAL